VGSFGNVRGTEARRGGGAARAVGSFRMGALGESSEGAMTQRGREGIGFVPPMAFARGHKWDGWAGMGAVGRGGGNNVFLAAQVWVGAGVVNSAVVKTAPEPCPFRVLFVLFHAAVGLRMVDAAHWPPPLVCRWSSAVPRPSSVVSRWSQCARSLYIYPPALRRRRRRAQRDLSEMRFLIARSGKKFRIFFAARSAGVARVGAMGAARTDRGWKLAASPRPRRQLHCEVVW
jgi:hypothetical protein